MHRRNSRAQGAKMRLAANDIAQHNARRAATCASGAIFVHVVSPLTLCYTMLRIFRVGVTVSGTSCGTRKLCPNSRLYLNTA